MADRPAQLAATVRQSRGPTSIAAGRLHDIGCAPDLRSTGFPPVDGARHLQEHCWNDDVVDGIAHKPARLVPVRQTPAPLLSDFVFRDSDLPSR